MVWKPVDGETAKPPLKFDEEEKKEVKKEVLISEQEKFRRELLKGEMEPDPAPSNKPNVTILDTRVKK
jgi:hypothetical protein